jgi:hypothetical protein
MDRYRPAGVGVGRRVPLSIARFDDDERESASFD